MKPTKMSTIVVLALGLMVLPASVAEGAQYLTVNGKRVSSITLELGQSCTVEVVSKDSTSYEDAVGFGNPGAHLPQRPPRVLGDFSHLETMPEAGNSATVRKITDLYFYGYGVTAAGRGITPGVHFIFQYEAQQVGETNVGLSELIKDKFVVIDSVHITIIPLPVAMGTAFTYQGRLIDANDVADGLYDLQFELYDNPGPFAAQQGNTIDVNELDVIDGYFTVELDFGSDVFAGDARWLEIGVRSYDPCDVNAFTTLSPRQEVTPTPYAIYAQEAAYAQGATDLTLPYSGTVSSGAAAFSMTNTGTGIYGEATGTSGKGVYGVASNSGNVVNYGGFFQANGRIGTGVLGAATGSDGQGVYGEATGSDGQGIYGRASNSGDVENYGGHFRADGTYGRGVYSYATHTGSGPNYGGHFTAAGENGRGVYGYACSSGNVASYGVYGKTNSSEGYAGYFAGGRNYFEGNVGIGTTSPSGALYTSSKTLEIKGIAPSIVLNDTDGTYIDDFEISNGGDRVRFRDATDNVDLLTLWLSGGREGRVSLQVLEITGGSDLSEQFEVSDEVGKVKPGMVVCIDADNPGNLVVSNKACDRTVAGIVSGAGGVKPGMLMGHKGTEADGEHAVALSGRVYCRADASNGPIEPGDLLTTSDMAGHAMKVTDYTKAQGAILGKAMSSLESGKGLVLVLVSLHMTSAK